MLARGPWLCPRAASGQQGEQPRDTPRTVSRGQHPLPRDRLAQFVWAVGEPLYQGRCQSGEPGIRWYQCGARAERHERSGEVRVPVGIGGVREERDRLLVADDLQDAHQAPHGRLGQRRLRPWHGDPVLIEEHASQQRDEKMPGVS